MDDALRALAAPTRRAILALVRDDELAAGQIASHFDLSRPAISQHLAVLRAAGLLTEQRVGTRRLYRARPAALHEIRAYLDGFWTDALDRLRSEAEKEEGITRDDRS